MELGAMVTLSCRIIGKQGIERQPVLPRNVEEQRKLSSHPLLIRGATPVVLRAVELICSSATHERLVRYC